jgi:hypothetical protein
MRYRPGDLRFVRQEALPTSETLTPRRGTVLVEGETTGHAAHRLQTTRGRGTILPTPDGQLWRDLADTAEMVHEERGPVTRDAGV